VRSIELRCDVTKAVGLDEPLHTAVTVCLPDEVTEPPRVICFGWPGGGYNRHYSTFDMPDGTGVGEEGGQAGWHTARGWLFAACDLLHCGDSSLVSDASALTYEQLVAASHATVESVMTKLADGSLDPALPPTAGLVKIGIGQSLGAAMIVLQQGQRHTFDAIGVLGWSGIHAVSWRPAGDTSPPPVYIPRGANVAELAADFLVAAMPEMALGEDRMPLVTPGFHFDDVGRGVVSRDMTDYPARDGDLPTWGSATIPPCAMTMMSPGAVAPEAAMIRVPVLVAAGERDVVPDPKREPLAYTQAADITVYVCPRMAHMHNFAGTRHQLWARIHAWGTSIAML
jgi:hypothetical protein